MLPSAGGFAISEDGYFLQNKAPLKLVSKSYPLYDFNTVINVSMKLGANIKLHWDKNHNSSIFSELFSLGIYNMKIVSVLQL